MPSERPPADAYDFEQVVELAVLRTGELIRRHLHTELTEPVGPSYAAFAEPRGGDTVSSVSTSHAERAIVFGRKDRHLRGTSALIRPRRQP
jgi:hypothetical protein